MAASQATTHLQPFLLSCIPQPSTRVICLNTACWLHSPTSRPPELTKAAGQRPDSHAWHVNSGSQPQPPFSIWPSALLPPQIWHSWLTSLPPPEAGFLPALSSASCVTTGKLFNLSGLPWNKDNKHICLLGLLWGFNEFKLAKHDGSCRRMMCPYGPLRVLSLQRLLPQPHSAEHRLLSFRTPLTCHLLRKCYPHPPEPHGAVYIISTS